MSCVAEPKATATAHHTMGAKASCGSVSAIITSAPMMTACDTSSQLRRRPSRRVSTGIGMRSTSGDQTHLKPYASPTQLKKPIVVRSMPASRSQKLRVPKTSNRGRPAEKPRDNMRSEAGSR